MVEQKYIEHHIQRSILAYLMEHEFARFRDMRPERVDTNLYSYHLKLLQKMSFVIKTDEGYTLTTRGMGYVDRINAESVKLSLQPKIVTMLVVQNGYGDVLMYKKRRQPFIEKWTLPFGKVHDDASLQEAAEREVREKIGVESIEISHAGDCYVRVMDEGRVKISTLMHIFYGTLDEPLEDTSLHWISPHKVPQLDAAPAIKDIISRTYFRDPYFFEEFTIDW